MATIRIFERKGEGIKQTQYDFYLFILVRRGSEGYILSNTPFLERNRDNIDCSQASSDESEDFMTPNASLPKPRLIPSRKFNSNLSISDSEESSDDNKPLIKNRTTVVN